MPDTIERFRQTLEEEASRRATPLSEDQLDALCTHYALIRTWNRRVRLVGTTDPTRAAHELFADSLIAARFAEEVAMPPHGQRPPRILDIGSGAGLPGIIIKIVHPEWTLAVVDSHAKKISFLRVLIQRLRLEDTEVFRGRAEALALDERFRERYDIVFCRAVISPAAACELAIPFVKLDGWFIGQMGEFGQEEDARLRKTAAVLGANPFKSISYNLTGVALPRSLVAFRKISSTPLSYPRAMRKIRRSPLA